MEKKKFNIENFFTEKNFFYREKYEWKCKKHIYLIWEIYFYAENVCVINKIQIFLNIYSFCKKRFFWS